METQNTSKSADEFICEKCNFKCSKRGDYNRHLATGKHKRINLETKKTSFTSHQFVCDCGKEYKNRDGLWKHKRKCFPVKTPEETPEKVQHEAPMSESSHTEIMKAFMKDNRDMMVSMVQNMITANKEMVVDLVPKLQPHITNNTNNTNINVNMFLNEQCKDAINFTDFVERIEVSHDDLENNAQLGFVNGISKIIRDNLQQLTLYERPIHCTDVKRETLYIKDADEWQKQSNEKLHTAIQEVSRKSIGSLLEWKQTNKDENIDSDFSQLCMNIQKESMAGYNKDNYYSKIVQNIAKDSKLDMTKE